jgi:gamma-glutamyltranspeptidase/glutathione hydrolase
MVVCPEPLAAEIGGDVLARGGNAADAAVAAAFAQGVTNPLMCGLSGTAIVLKMDRRGSGVVLNGECAIGSRPVPSAWIESPIGRSEAIGRYFIPSEDNQIGPSSTMVPGFVAACDDLHRRFGSGRIRWAELIEPSIRLAIDGYAVYPYIAAGWATSDGGEAQDRPGYPSLRTKLARDPLSQTIYLKRGREPFVPGDILTQVAYGNTLDQLASCGARDFYVGHIARTMAEDLARRGSLVDRSDLRKYRVVDQNPIRAFYGPWDVVTTPPPSPGVQVLEMLGILDRLNFRTMDFESPDALDIFAKVMRAGFADNLDIKAVRIAEADDWASRISDPQRLDNWAKRIAQGGPIVGAHEMRGTGTTHVSVVDDEGMSIGFTHSIGSIAGSGAVTPGLGFLHNNFLGHFDPRPGTNMSIEPERRIGSGMPTVVRESGETRLLLGAPGGSRIITALLQVLVHRLDHRMDIHDAVAHPRIHSEEANVVNLEPSWPENTLAGLAARGNDVCWNGYQARVQAIAIDEAGDLFAGADPRGGAMSRYDGPVAPTDPNATKSRR